MSSPITPAAYAGSVHHGADRRRAERSATNIQAILRFQDRMQVIQGCICDLSIGGVGFICQQAVAAHSKCTLQFTLPALNQAPGHMVTVPVTALNSMQVIGQARQFRINLQFAGLPSNVRSHIESFIRQSLSCG
ncbi:MAG TPA: PilZ domain-containing protein [Noviherbaspirillum sp.]|nr:PilZ domain-containing protein [Noviherbaspirillum sp.]